MLTPSLQHYPLLPRFVRSLPTAFGISVVALLALGPFIAQPAEAKGRPRPPAPAPAEPGPRFWHSMSGDGSESEHGVYLYGGDAVDADGNWTALGDFWFYDLKSSAWRLVKPGGKIKPGTKVHAGLSCDTEQCILAQGYPSNRKGSATDTWIYTKSTNSWSELNCATAFCPGPRTMAAFAFDSYRGSHVLFGGEGRRSSDFLGDTYTFSGGAWRQRFPTHSPSPRFAAAMAFVPTLNRIVLFGGQIRYGQNSSACDMWAWSGSDWEEITQSGGPCLAAHSMTWDTSSATPRLLVTGGYKDWSEMTRNPDVWSFTLNANGRSGTWTKHASSSLSCSYKLPYVGLGEPFYPESKMAADGNPNKKVFFGGVENLENGAFAYAGLIVCD